MRYLKCEFCFNEVETLNKRVQCKECEDRTKQENIEYEKTYLRENDNNFILKTIDIKSVVLFKNLILISYIPLCISILYFVIILIGAALSAPASFYSLMSPTIRTISDILILYLPLISIISYYFSIIFTAILYYKIKISPILCVALSIFIPFTYFAFSIHAIYKSCKLISANRKNIFL